MVSSQEILSQGAEMKGFEELQFEEHPMAKNLDPMNVTVAGLFSPNGGSTFSTQSRMFFDNGYGVSVITGSAAYDKYEIAILEGDEKTSSICYTTPITSDVIPCGTEEDVTNIMHQVQNL